MGKLNLICGESNDLYKIIISKGIDINRYDTFEEAINNSEESTGILYLADTYPIIENRLSEENLLKLQEKNIKLYIEYPSSISGLDISEPILIHRERVVVSSDFFKPEEEKLGILETHSSWYVSAKEEVQSHLVIAKVAGYMKAVYGLPKETIPYLFNHPEYMNVMVCAGCLSCFRTARYAPYPTIKNIIEKILKWISSDDLKIHLDWEPPVKASYKKQEKLPLNFEQESIEKNKEWFRKHMVNSIDSWKGVFEGFEAHVDYRGNQIIRDCLRADCIAESAMVFAIDWKMNKNPYSKKLCEAMLANVWENEIDFYSGDSSQPEYGLVNWSVKHKVYYGDDNARVLLASLACISLLDTDRFSERILRSIFANLRIMGPEGFQEDRHDHPTSMSKEKDWKYWSKQSFIEIEPHFQCYIWAVDFWLYRITGMDFFIERSKKGLITTMEAYPDKWRWTNGIMAEVSRMLLPLAAIYRIEAKKEYEEWIEMLVNDIDNQIDANGAMLEKIAYLENGKYPPPKSNESFGTAEASIIQEDGDPACDLLYSANWAYIGINEVYKATGNEKYKKTLDKMTEFLCRIQISSKEHPEFDGCWMRSFDSELWEYYGSNADAAWSAWSVESGWMNAWIHATIAFKQMDTGLFDLDLTNKFTGVYEKIKKEML